MRSRSLLIHSFLRRDRKMRISRDGPKKSCVKSKSDKNVHFLAWYFFQFLTKYQIHFLFTLWSYFGIFSLKSLISVKFWQSFTKKEAVSSSRKLLWVLSGKGCSNKSKSAQICTIIDLSFAMKIPTESSLGTFDPSFSISWWVVFKWYLHSENYPKE